MSKLTAQDLMKLAASSEKARNFVLHLAKVANGESDFDETVPAMNTEQLEADKAALPSQSPKENVPPEPAAVPEEAPVAAPAPEGPEAIGARAAQSFIGPEIMQAAASGDVAAADLVARTAGQVAGAVAESAIKATAPVEETGAAGIPADPSAAPMAPPAIATPE